MPLKFPLMLLKFKSMSFFLVFFVISVSKYCIAESQIIRLATQDWAPFQTLGANGQMTGVAVTKVVCALEASGSEFELIMMPWKDAQNYTESGVYDGFFSASINSRRSKYAVPSSSLVTGKLAWFLRPATIFDPFTPAEKNDARYGAVFASNKWQTLKRAGYRIEKKPRSTEALFRMLQNSDVDVVLEYMSVYQEYIKSNKLRNDQFKIIPYKSNNMYVYFSKLFLQNRPTFLDTFNSSLQSCKEVGK